MKLSIPTFAVLCLGTTSYAHNVDEGNLRTREHHSRNYDQEQDARAQQQGRWGIDQDMLREGRIAGGSQANEANYPYFVHLGGCGASLIAPGVLLGAAHCGDYTSSDPDDYVIAAGQQAWITSSVNHTSWDGNQYDLQLMRLDTNAMYSSNIELVLNDDNDWPSSGSMTVIGYGIISENGPDSEYLREIDTPFMTFERCEELWGDGVYKESMICTGGRANKGACAGDSGGPLVVKEGNDHYLVGTVSHGDGCGFKDSPSIYVRLSAAMPWIQSVVCQQWNVQANFC